MPTVNEHAGDCPSLHDVHGVRRDASVVVSVCNLANCAIGAGVLSLPFAIRHTGAALGLVLACAVAAVIVFTLDVLVRAGEAHGAVSYQELVRKALGPAASHLVSLTLVVYIFGSCVAYQIIIADAAGAVLRGALGVSHLALTREVVIAATACAVLLPLSLLRRTTSLAPASTLSVVALAYTTVAVVVKGCLRFSNPSGDERGGNSDVGTEGPGRSWSWESSTWNRGKLTVGGLNVDLWRLDAGTISALPVLVFAFQCHIQVLSIFAELRDDPPGVGGALDGKIDGSVVGDDGDSDAVVTAPSSAAVSPSSSTSSLPALLSSSQPAPTAVPEEGIGVDVAERDGEGTAGGPTDRYRPSRRRRTMQRVVAAAILTCLAGYALVGEFAYVTHPDVQSNMLNSYSTDDRWMLAASASMGVSAVGSYPINHFSSRAATDDLLAAALGWAPAAPGTAPRGRHVSQTLAFLAATTALALRVRDLGKVFQLVGSTAGVLVMFVIPGLLLLRPGAQRTPPAAGWSEGEPGENGDVVGIPRTQPPSGGRWDRRARRGRRGGGSGHWTEGTGSIGGYDELGLRAALLPEPEGGGGWAHGGLADGLDREDGGGMEGWRAARGSGDGGDRSGRRSVTAADKMRGYALLLLGAFISSSNIYVLFFRRTSPEGRTPASP